MVWNSIHRNGNKTLHTSFDHVTEYGKWNISCMYNRQCRCRSMLWQRNLFVSAHSTQRRCEADFAGYAVCFTPSVAIVRTLFRAYRLQELPPHAYDSWGAVISGCKWRTDSDGRMTNQFVITMRLSFATETILHEAYDYNRHIYLLSIEHKQIYI